jgi:Lycopene cyclase
MAGDVRYAYALGSSLFIPLWLLLFWRNPASRREMLLMSALFTVSIGVPLELLLYSRDWWHPHTITDTRIGIEDVIYSIGNGGYMAVLYAAVFRPRFATGAPREQPPLVLRLAPLMVMMGVPLLLAYVVGLRAFESATAGSLLALAIVLIARADLARIALASAILATALALPVYLAMEAVFPGMVAATWDLPNLSGLLPLGIPIEDLAWYLYTAALWSTYYKFATGMKVLDAGYAFLHIALRSRTDVSSARG